MPASSQQSIPPPARPEEEISTASESEAEEEIKVPA
ncbi:hypothetical protein H9Q70_014701, partial [Fusarium xylarioides]